MQLMWLSVYFFSAAGLFLFHVYAASESYLVPALLLGAGTLCAAFAFCRTRQAGSIPDTRTALVLCLPVIAGIAAFPQTYCIALWMLLAGLLLTIVRPSGILFQVQHGLLAGGVIFGMQTLILHPYTKLAARFHEWPYFDFVFLLMLRLMGLDCSYSNSTLFVQTQRSTIPLVASWEKLGLYFAIVYAVGAVAVMFVLCRNVSLKNAIRQFASVVIITIVYTVIRYIGLCVLYVDTGLIRAFWEPAAVAVSFVPLAVVSAVFVTLPNAVRVIEPVQFSRSLLRGYAAAFLLGLSLAGLCWFHDPGVDKRGRVLIDEHYSDWEWTDRKLDTDWYGIQSVYNYYCMRDFLSHYYSVDTLDEPLTDSVLEECDVLILKTPTRSFSPEAIDRIVQYVEEGGGLFLIGDHTNVFGSTMHMNPLSDRFGIHFNFDATYNLRTNDLHLHKQTATVRHPAVVWMPYFLFATSCTLDAALSADDIMTASDMKAINLDYSRGGYFPDKKTEHNFTFGMFLQSVGVKYGGGRVAAFSDSTCFSNFYMYIPGKPEFVLGTVSWLNGKNYFGNWFTVVLWILTAAAGIVFAAACVTKKNNHCMVTATGCVLLGLALGALLCAQLVREPPTEGKPFKKVAFDTGLCSFSIPDKQLLHNDALDYHTFYVWTQRLGYRPYLTDITKERPALYDVIVLVDPFKRFADDEISRINAFLRQGGRMLLIDKPGSRLSTANMLLEQFGIRIHHDRLLRKQSIREHGRECGTINACSPVSGGTPLLETDQGELFAVKKRIGRGMIAVLCCSDSFTNSSMGETENVPDKQQQFLYRLQFWLFSSLMNNEFEDFLKK